MGKICVQIEAHNVYFAIQNFSRSKIIYDLNVMVKIVRKCHFTTLFSNVILQHCFQSSLSTFEL